MGNLGFLVLIIFIFLFQALGQLLKGQPKEAPRKDKPRQDASLEEILETLGFPAQEEPEPAATEVVIEEKKEEAKIEQEEALKETVAEEKKIEPPRKEEPEEEKTLSLDKLEEAIIYSTIIGPPKALTNLPMVLKEKYAKCRSGGIGRHA